MIFFVFFIHGISSFCEKSLWHPIFLNVTVLDERSSENTAIILLSNHCPSPFSFVHLPFFSIFQLFLLLSRKNFYIVFPIYTVGPVLLFILLGFFIFFFLSWHYLHFFVSLYHYHSDVSQHFNDSNSIVYFG